MNFAEPQYLLSSSSNSSDSSSSSSSSKSTKIRIKNRWGPHRKAKNLALSLTPLDLDDVGDDASSYASSYASSSALSRQSSSLRSSTSLAASIASAADPNSVCSQWRYRQRLQAAANIIKNDEMETAFNLLLLKNQQDLYGSSRSSSSSTSSRSRSRSRSRSSSSSSSSSSLSGILSRSSRTSHWSIPNKSRNSRYETASNGI